jgi:hypothetical protein
MSGTTVVCKMKANSIWIDAIGQTHIRMFSRYVQPGEAIDKVFNDGPPDANCSLIIAKDKVAKDLFESDAEYEITFRKL